MALLQLSRWLRPRPMRSRSTGIQRRFPNRTRSEDKLLLHSLSKVPPPSVKTQGTECAVPCQRPSSHWSIYLSCHNRVHLLKHRLGETRRAVVERKTLAISQSWGYCTELDSFTPVLFCMKTALGPNRCPEPSVTPPSSLEKAMLRKRRLTSGQGLRKRISGKGFGRADFAALLIPSSWFLLAAAVSSCR
jgi:hypothetical protein